MARKTKPWLESLNSVLEDEQKWMKGEDTTEEAGRRGRAVVWVWDAKNWTVAMGKERLYPEEPVLVGRQYGYSWKDELPGDWVCDQDLFLPLRIYELWVGHLIS